MTEQALDRPAVDTTDGGTVDALLAVVRRILERPTVGPDDDVLDNGGTSLSVVRILAEAHTDLGIDIDPRDLDGIVTARALARAGR